MVRRRDKSVGGSARRHNLPIQTQLKMQGVHPHVAKVCSIHFVGQLIRTCCGLDQEASKENAVFFTLSTSFHPAGQYLSLSGQTGQTGMISSSVPSPTAIQVYDTNDTDIPYSNHSTRSVKSMKLNISRHSGNYEVNYALKSIHLDRMNDISFVNEMKVSMIYIYILF